MHTQKILQVTESWAGAGNEATQTLHWLQYEQVYRREGEGRSERGGGEGRGGEGKGGKVENGRD